MNSRILTQSPTPGMMRMTIDDTPRAVPFKVNGRLLLALLGDVTTPDTGRSDTVHVTLPLSPVNRYVLRVADRTVVVALPMTGRALAVLSRITVACRLSQDRRTSPPARTNTSALFRSSVFTPSIVTDTLHVGRTLDAKVSAGTREATAIPTHHIERNNQVGTIFFILVLHYANSLRTSESSLILYPSQMSTTKGRHLGALG